MLKGDDHAASGAEAQSRCRDAVESIFRPASVAVVGASNDPKKYGYNIAERVLRGKGARRVHLVHRGQAEILGVQSVASLSDLPEVPELVVLCVPAATVPAVVEEALGLGTRAFICISAGFAETGEQGAELQTRLARMIDDAGAVLLGPNCLGVYDSEAAFDCLPWANSEPGHVALIAQSGTVIMDIDERIRDIGLGFSRAVSIGNQADLRTSELVVSMTRDERTRVIALYVEDFREGRALMRAIADAVAAGRPVVVLAPASEPAQRAAQSHTAALASERAIVEVACRASGAILVDSIREMAVAIQALSTSGHAVGRRVGLVSDSGGMTVLGAEALTKAGLSVPRLAESSKQTLVPHLSSLALPDNPIDMAGAVNPPELAAVTRALVAAPELDAVLVALTRQLSGPRSEQMAFADALVAELEDSAKPVVISAHDTTSVGAQALRAGGLAVYRDLEDAALAISAVCDDGEGAKLPELPEQHPDAEMTNTGATDTSYFGARRLLSEAGIRFAGAAEVNTVEEAVRAARELGFPLALKWLGALHKSDAGGVVLGIKSEEELEAALVRMQQQLPPATYSLEEMVVPDGTEVDLIVGATRDRDFGPVLTVGVGGIFTEVLNDVQLLIAPATVEQCEVALRSLRGAGMLTGARGRPPVHLKEVAKIAAALSRLAAQRPDIAEIEINPLRARPDGAIALDARVITSDAQ